MNADTSSPISEAFPLTSRSQSVTVSEGPDPSVVLSWVCQQCSLRRDNNILRTERGYWRNQYQRVKAREAQLLADIKELEAKLKLREDQLFGCKSEVCTSGSEQQRLNKTSRRKRGQQPGAPGHGRRRHEQLPSREERYDLPSEEQCCAQCGLPYAPLSGTEDSELVEIAVTAHVRQIRRSRYTPTCSCPGLPGIMTAPGPPKLIPKGAYGASLWSHIIVEKFLHYRPITRLVNSLGLLGVEVSAGTITGGLKRLAPLFALVYQAIIEQNQQAPHWHADETRWLVFAEVQGKVGHRWYLWVFQAASTVVYLLDPSRSSTVPLEHLQDTPEGILSVDRYHAYKTFVNAHDGEFQLAYCWAHVRRDFLRIASSRSDQQAWAMGWVERIATLYHLNNQRRAAQDDSERFAELDTHLREAVRDMEQQRETELNDKHLLIVRRKVLASLKEHWEGLTLFVEHPKIPMDNNAAERALRGPVVGRKNFYGSGALWSGTLAAMLFTLFRTLLLWHVNPRTWLHRFFQVCAEHGGKPLEDVSRFLPWNMTAADLDTYRRAPPSQLASPP